MEKNVRKVEKFVANCNDMLSGRFLDFNKKIENIANSINDSDDILSYLATKILDGDREEIFNHAFVIDNKTKNGKISLPSEEKEKLTLFVTVINDLYSHKLNANKFLETYFRGGQGTPTQLFLEKIIEPFKNMIADYFKVDKSLTLADLSKKEEEISEEEFADIEEDDEVNFETEFEEEDMLALSINNIVRVCDELEAKLKFEKKHESIVEDFGFMISALKHACAQKDMQNVNGLILGINYVSHKIKSTKYLVNELNEIVYNIYQSSNIE